MKGWTKGWALAVIFAALMTNIAWADQAQPLTLLSGAQRQLEFSHPLTRAAVGDPSVADALALKNAGHDSLLLIGKAPGLTNLMVWLRGQTAPLVYTVEVHSAAAAALLDDKTPRVQALDGDVIISGTTPTLQAHQHAVDAARLSKSQGGTIIDTSHVTMRSVVQTEVRVIEFSRTVLKATGLNFFKQSNGFSFGSFTPTSLQSISGGATAAFAATAGIPIASAFNLVLNSAGRGIFANLSLLEDNDLARVLAEPTLVALSGQSASFLAGGEIPVPVPQGLGTVSIQYKPYGVRLTLTPTVLSAQRIALKVAPEASALDFQNAIVINGISVPAITTRRADTTVELGDGESFVIGGLIDRATQSNISKIPLLGDLPIIGAFFKQMNYQQNDKELLIIVTPHLVAPLAPGAVLPTTPGELSEQRDAPVWRSYLGGVAADDAAPGFSK